MKICARFFFIWRWIRPVPGQVMISYAFAIIFGISQISATTLVAPSTPCDRIIHELRAGGDIPSHELFLKMADLYKRLLIPSLTTADLEGLLASPLEFRNWSTPTLQGQVGERLDEMQKGISARLSVAEQTRFLKEIAPAIIREEIEKRNASNTSWKLSKGIFNLSPIKKFNALDGKFVALAFSPDGKTLYVSAGKNISARDSTTGKILYTLEQSKSLFVTKMKISGDGRFLYTDADDRHVAIWDLEKRELVKMPAHKVRRITAIANSHDGAFLYSGSSSGRLRLSDLRKKNRIGTFYNWIRDLYLPHRLGKKNWGPIADLAVSPGNEILYSLISYGLIEFVDLKTGKIVRPLKFEDSSPARFVLSHDGKILFIGLHDGSIEEVDVNTRKIIRSRDPHQDSVTALALSPEGNILYSASDDKTIGIWNLKTGESFQVPFVDQINFGQLVSLEVTPDGRRLFLVKDTGDAFVLDLERAHPHWIEKEDAR